ncbi:flagellar hook-length control protein FliK [Pseudodesulfovibrio piezophilus]|uniref:Flagellar hook-length control protein n=1 Tax=Pseudodesulfovibrio piezophilus (strain DSM 21447 / JCM 15486 / C1TLV30) TaxID=1322246 RepID=M1WXN9_PSEP2|nr:flagellar hook-length control protein FliK [Pseudodesulfovibrio piezophilus]CCH49823.1 Flagellar hook-length control protein [Pseudodesulfovibrio piezophilus C1TLV30]
MQNLPGIALDQTTEQAKSLRYSSLKTSEQDILFAELFEQHSTKVENELALTPVSTNDQMLETAPEIATHEAKQEKVNASGTEAPAAEETVIEVEKDQDQKMTQEDLDEVREDLKEYGLSEEEISDIEDKINSDEGMTWNEFVSVLAEKMASMNTVSLSDTQKDTLSTFFSKFGFSESESKELISKLQNGNQNEVMAALQEKLDAMPDDQKLLLTKDELEAFSSAMNFSKEFTSKLKEAFGQNTLSKDVKEAFTMIQQEMAEMSAKDQALVKAVGQQFVKAMHERTKETTVAKEVGENVDLKARTAEETPQVATKEELKDAVETRKDALSDASARKTDQQNLPKQADADVTDQDQSNESSNDTWNNFFSKLQNNSTQKTTSEFQGKTDTIEATLASSLTDATGKTSTQAWEKISAPKVMRQVENGVLKTLSNGTKQLTLQLSPENLGALSITLQVNGKEVSAHIRADSADAAKVIADNLDIIKTSLQNQGLKVDKLDVQTGLMNNSDYNNWFGQEEHNLAREREAMVAMRSHMKQMREGTVQVAQDLQNVREQAIHADQGLHVIA